MHAYGNCDAMGTARGTTQWRRRWTALSPHSLPLAPLGFITLSGHGAVSLLAIFGGHTSGARTRPDVVRNRRSGTADAESRRLLPCAPGVKAARVCCASRSRVVGAGVIYPMDIYTHIYIYTLLLCRTISWLPPLVPPSHLPSFLVCHHCRRRRRGRLGRRRRRREATARHSFP